LRNNSLAMLATIAGIGILAWFIGFFDPETCVPDVQQAGWTSCQNIANERAVALWVLIGVTIAAASFTLIRSRKRRS